MMTTDDTFKTTRIRRLEVLRVVAGLAGIVTMVAVLVIGISAFANDEDSWMVIKPPLVISLLFFGGAARFARMINETNTRGIYGKKAEPVAADKEHQSRENCA